MNELLIAFLATLPATLTSIGGLIGVIWSIRVSMGNRKAVAAVQEKADAIDKKATATAATLTTVETHTNGLLAAAKQDAISAKAVGDAKAAGLVAGAQQERERAKDR